MEVEDKKAAADQVPETKVITLRKPVTLGETYTTLTLQEPTADQWSKWDKMEGVAADIMAVSVVSGVPEPAVRMIGARDLTEASHYIAHFLP